RPAFGARPRCEDQGRGVALGQGESCWPSRHHPPDLGRALITRLSSSVLFLLGGL
uniref:Uncharacterized protein n=1 Tax=Aegilops tauschii subsp. strangulata TaxID=200361 RepID=A0A453EVE3_AEGTS